MVAAKTILELPAALLAISLIVLHTCVMGYWALRWLRYECSNLWAAIALHGSAGLALLGLEMFLLGYVHAWHRHALLLSGVIMLMGLHTARDAVKRFAAALHSELNCLYRANRLLAVSCGLMLSIVLVGGLRPPFMTDEVQYHWAAPIYWARNGHWILSPYRLMNGPALMHLLYLVSALFSSAIAAHWTHAFCLLLLACACAGLAQACTASPIAAFAGVFSSPVLVMQGAISYNDVGATLFCVCAYVALLCGSENMETPASNILIGGLLFAAAYSVKSLMLAALPVALIFVMQQAWQPQIAQQQRARVSICNALLLLGPLLITVGIWMIHCYALSGNFFDSRNVHILHNRTDPLYHTGGEIGRIPDLRDLMTLPFMPFFTSVLGQREPWGGRTGLLIVPFLPIGWMALRRLSPRPRAKSLWIATSAATSLLILGMITEKTRYHGFLWPMLLVIVAIGYNAARNHKQPDVARVGMIAFVLLAWLGMADAAHVVLRGILALP